MRKGVYRENLSLRHGGSPRRRIRLRSYPGEAARLIGQLTVNRTAPNLLFERLYIDGANASRSPSPIVTARRVTFANNDVTNDHTAICFLLGVDGYGRAQEVVIRRNRIHDCGRLPRTELDHGIYVENTDDVLISQNWIYDNADFGVHLYPDAQRTTVTGNVIDGNGMGLVFAGDGPDASNDNLVEHNVISNSVERYNVEEYFGGPTGRGNVLRRNCLGGGARDDGNGGIQVPHEGFQAIGNIVAAARFPARAARSFRLSARSPCLRVLPRASVPPGVGTPAPPAAFVHLLRVPRRARPGGALRVAGVVVVDNLTYPRQALLQLRRGSAWQTLATAPVSSRGRFSLAYRPSRKRARARLRVIAPGARRSRSFSVRIG